MQRRVIAFGGLLSIWIAQIAVGCGGTRTVSENRHCCRRDDDWARAPREMVFYGHIKSLVSKGAASSSGSILRPLIRTI